MKNSKKVLIGALLAASTLVGATVATYVVTDNAAAVGVKVSPGTIETDTDTPVTLSYGTNVFTQVDNLGLGETRKAAVLDLKAEGVDSYSGLLDVELVDQTVAQGERQYKLTNYLKVDLYAGALDNPGSSKAGYLDGELSKSIPVSGSPTGSKYTAFVSLSSTITDAALTAIANDVVYLQFNWNMAASGSVDKDQYTKTVYMVDEGNLLGAAPKVYAFGSGYKNGDWPGEDMTVVDANKHIFSYGVKAQATTLVFANEEGNKQTVDISFEDHTTDNIYFAVLSETDGEGKYTVSAGNVDPTGLADYYVTGLIGGADQWYASVGFVDGLKMVADGENNIAKKENVTLAENDLIKVISKTGQYYGAQMGEHADEMGNFKIEAAGTYTIYLNNEGYVWCQLEA